MVSNLSAISETPLVVFYFAFDILSISSIEPQEEPVAALSAQAELALDLSDGLYSLILTWKVAFLPWYI
jgi:hypothetical protein